MTCTVLSMACLQLSCVVPKALVVAEVPAAKAPEKVAELPTVTPAAPTLVEDGLMMPNMLAMPSDNDLRSVAKPQPKMGSEVGEVIARPPTEPPSRIMPANE
jgi:hypothetical protein